MKPLKTAVLALLVTWSAWAGAGDGHRGTPAVAMARANPMPNLMMIVQRHGGELNLSADQARALARWQETQRGILHDKLREMLDLEQAIESAALGGGNKAELMALVNRSLALQRDIASTKIDCRDYVARTLHPEQYEKLLVLYRQYAD